MTWLAVVFFCLSEDDCNFWSKETLRPVECERVLSQTVTTLTKAGVPVVYGACLPVKGSDT
jgi:hypothetical protein